MPKAKAPALDRSASEQAIQLLDAATDHVLANGLGDLSLRSVADALGTSHRMLIYYFGSGDGFWQALLHRIRHAEQAARQRVMVEGMAPEAAMEAAWERYSAPAYLPIMQLMFEIYGKAIRDRERFSGFLEDVVGSWTTTLAARLQRDLGLGAAEAGLRARVELATMRGLLLDLVTTGDRKGTTAALKYFAARMAVPPQTGK
ncbi:transcriptional regulator TetR family [Cupriavidus necator N-1]|jgi:AcrR family transcriptional regulator|uniref:Transcriptional regulator TetR family n=1 Tax=Cupriavidus necator (strain ATCC 43291 / DSM 13513 / CCUG 52238 / LMG 8453 / N-1) TaxID=1042878 RepID=F8GST9_CUPNN|nr:MULTISPECIES: TetR/AcrR family transcriptional regulator [Cupriavidus]AEI79858.1 transcriptional regulator TetR family [Cupriavidus necator N-1]KAI3599514.1 Transcriptional regulator, AcrR family [Cupriavidus necator H850]MDX6010508.1 TetR/AcrR family transcriptional regulator [Cupriavidus necator]QUN30108.1 TetR/AcrR family transcriptional regulator [Cupriavidus sp. KK10]